MAKAAVNIAASNKVLVLSGPTAAGKTGLAMALSDSFPIELVNMDSAQLYRHMDIGTAKISKAEQQHYPHHLIDIIEPQQSYSVSEYFDTVNALIDDIHRRGNVPLLVGGTMLYLNALYHGLANLPKADNKLRAELKTILDNEGHAALLSELKQIDAELASKIQGNDTQRLLRFVEIARLTGKPPSYFFSQQQYQPPYSIYHIAFMPEDRVVLHRRIELRFELMLKQGFIDEVKWLRQHYQLTADMPSMRCVGYRQVWDYLEGQIDYAELVAKGVAATRQLAKRQYTWLRKLSKDKVITDAEQFDLQAIIALVRTQLSQT